MSIVSAIKQQYVFFFFSSRRRHTRFDCDWSSDVCSSDLVDPTHIHVTNHRDQSASDGVMDPCANRGEINGNKVAEIIGKKYRVGGGQHERCAPIPPARKESPEVAESCAHPAVEPALDRNRGSQLGRH